MNAYPLVERLMSNHDAVKHFSLRFRETNILPEAALIGVTYSGTASLRNYLLEHPNIVGVQKVHECTSAAKEDKVVLQSLANELFTDNKHNVEILKKILSINEHKDDAFLLNILYFAKKYMVGAFYTDDVLTQQTFVNIFSLFKDEFCTIPREGNIVPVLLDTYSFTYEEPFCEPWYYSQNTKFIITMRNPTDALYAAYKNEYDRYYWKMKFEDVIKIQYIKEIISRAKRPHISEIFDNLHIIFRFSLFKTYLQRWLKFFPSKNFYIIPNTELVSSKNVVLSEIFKILNIPNVHFAKEMPGYGFSSPAFNFKPMDNETRQILDDFFAHYNSGILELIDKCNVIGNQDLLFKRAKMTIELQDSGQKSQETSPKIFLDDKYTHFTFKTIHTILKKRCIEEDSIKQLIIAAIVHGAYGYACRLIELYHTQLGSEFHAAKRHLKKMHTDVEPGLWHETIAKIIPHNLSAPPSEHSLAKWALCYFFKEVYLKRYHHSPSEVHNELNNFIDMIHKN